MRPAGSEPKKRWKHDGTGSPFDVALHLLEATGGNAYRFAARAEERIRDSLERYLADHEDEDDAVDPLIALSIVLDEQCGQPELSQVIVDAIRASPRALAVLRRVPVGPPPEFEDASWKETDAQGLAASLSRRAPMIGAMAPEGSISARSLMRPASGLSGPRPLRRPSSVSAT